MTPEKLDTFYMQIRETAACVSNIKADLAVVKTDVAVLKERSDHTLDHCPMRERISSTESEIRHVGQDVLEMRVQLEKVITLAQTNRVNLAERSIAGVIGGGMVAIIVALIELLPRLMK